jgi:hypothetical protein
MLSDDKGEDLDTSFDDGGSHTSQPSSPILGSSSPLSSFQGVSPISDHSTLHVRDSSLAPPEADELELVNLLYKKFRVLQDQILSTRYLMARSVPIPHNSQMDLLWWYKDNSSIRFQRKVRVCPDTFDHILSRIQDDPIFISKSFIKDQIPAAIQLAIFLHRLGHYGNVLSVDDIAEWAGVSSGTVINCTKRCMLAIIKLHDDAMSMPTENKINHSKGWSQQTVIPEWRNG